jgi:hypothetical protein
VSAEELLQVPAASSDELMNDYSVTQYTSPAAGQPDTNNPYNGLGKVQGTANVIPNRFRYAQLHAGFGHLLNLFAASAADPTNQTYSTAPADVLRDPTTGVPILNPPPPAAGGNVQPYGAANFQRILDYVHVPSRFVGTDEFLNPDVFNSSAVSVSNPAGFVTGPDDPRYYLQPPFNKVSRERDPGRVNLNTVLGRRNPPSGATFPEIWSDVYDGMMHRYQEIDSAGRSHGDQDLILGGNILQLGHPGPAWLGVQLSRRGYMQLDAAGNTVDQLDTNFNPIDPLSPPGNLTPDSFAFGLNPNFPSFFSNPFRSADAGDLVPLDQMMQFGVDASWLRVHPYVRGLGSGGLQYPSWGNKQADARRAGFGGDVLSVRLTNGGIPNTVFTAPAAGKPPYRDILPLFSELRNDPSIDTTRNPYMMYQPMTRLGNLTTEHSGVFAVWVTVGYFEVTNVNATDNQPQEQPLDWNDPDSNRRLAVRQRFGGTLNDSDAATVAARALYDRVYPEGYALGQELGSDTGNTKRQRGFYIIDRTIPVGFKPGEDLNDDRAIKVRRRIE